MLREQELEPGYVMPASLEFIPPRIDIPLAVIGKN
jgi:hypothetical protein